MAIHSTGRFFFIFIFTNATSFTYRSEQIFNRITIMCRSERERRKKKTTDAMPLLLTVWGPPSSLLSTTERDGMLRRRRSTPPSAAAESRLGARRGADTHRRAAQHRRWGAPKWEIKGEEGGGWQKKGEAWTLRGITAFHWGGAGFVFYFLFFFKYLWEVEM